jgi:hypothetical protein
MIHSTVKKNGKIMTQNEILARLYFENLANDKSKWKCMECPSTTLTVKPGKGFTNQCSHIKSVHAEGWQHKLAAYEVELEKIQCSNKDAVSDEAEKQSISIAKASSLAQYQMPKKLQDIFFWLEWICLCLLPFSFVANEVNRNKAKRDKICVNTLKKYMEILCRYVEKDQAGSC